MCGRRGLEVESDLQTYEVALTTAFRDQFDRVLGPLRAERAEGASPPSAVSLGPRSKTSCIHKYVVRSKPWGQEIGQFLNEGSHSIRR